MELCHLDLELSGCNREMAALKRSDLRCIYLHAKWYRVVILYLFLKRGNFVTEVPPDQPPTEYIFVCEMVQGRHFLMFYSVYS